MVLIIGNWIYNYLCNKCLSPLKLWVRTLFMARCTRWESVSDRSVVFQFPPRYTSNWNIVECGVKHHKPSVNHALNMKNQAQIYIKQNVDTAIMIVELLRVIRASTSKIYFLFVQSDFYALLENNTCINKTRTAIYKTKSVGSNVLNHYFEIFPLNMLSWMRSCLVLCFILYNSEQIVWKTLIINAHEQNVENLQIITALNILYPNLLLS